MAWRFRISTLSLFCLASWPVAAQNGGCDALVNEAIRAGEIPSVIVDPKTKEAQLVTSKGTCVEAAGKWATRRLPGVPAEPAVRREVPGPAAEAPKPAAAPPPRPSAPPAPKCDRILEGLWGPMRVRVGGEIFWLARVHTIDFDNDGRTDNLGFKLKSKRGQEVALRYFAEVGDVGANSLPELQLDDDRNIGRICFGELDLAEPAEPVIPTMSGMSGMSGMVSMAPDLAAQARARVEGKATDEAAPPKKEMDSWLWAVLAGGAGLLLGAAAVLWFLTRHHGPAEGHGEEQEGEEDEVAHSRAEPEEEEEVPAKKLLGFLAGLKGKKKEAEPAEEEDERPPAHKPVHSPGKKGAPPQRGRPAARPKPSR